VEKTFKLIARQSATIRLNIFNSLNAATVTAEGTLSGPSYGIPSAILPPRTFEVSASYRF
jgi:outer membrane receptor protein involved in Fe transport